ncbi:MAG: hypothetical protein A2293_16335 [Elusimicrobia bacterium RIFOXYB2_FULL_49_7]|nr:MAG: hypothetical protein A2293_16335 [Elusimicrobia bacterium RIFOXYB2_FULL_49_7]
MRDTFFVPKDEIYGRIEKAEQALQATTLDGIFITDVVNILYYTGTVQNGVLFIPRNGEPVFFVRRSLERAILESPLQRKVGYVSFKEFTPVLTRHAFALGRIGMDESALSLSLFKLLQTNMSETVFEDCGLLLKRVRATKSDYEIAKIRKAGELSCELTAKIPAMLKVGITEWELGMKLYQEMSEMGRNCFPRLAPGSGEFFLGNVCFGINSTYPSSFDGPGGLAGRSPVCPYVGSEQRLESGDLVYIDLAHPFEEYCVDKTRLFSLGEPAAEVVEAHQRCLRIQQAIVERLKPGAILSAIYDDVMQQYVIQAGFQEHFMGYGANQVKFLGHGIGLAVNEYPAVAKKFDEPLEANMVLALEPKKGLPGAGMVGIENTFLTTKSGVENLTEDNDEIVVV